MKIDFYNILQKCYAENLINIANVNRIRFLSKKYIHSYEMVEYAKKIFGNVTDEETGALLLHDIGYFIDASEEAMPHTESGYNYLKNNYSVNECILAAAKFHDRDSSVDADLEAYYNQSELFGKVDYLKTTVKKVIDCDIVSNLDMCINSTEIDELGIPINENIVECLLCNRLGKNEFVTNRIDGIIYMVCGINLLFFEETKKYVMTNMINRVKKIVKLGYQISNRNEYMKILIYLDTFD